MILKQKIITKNINKDYKVIVFYNYFDTITSKTCYNTVNVFTKSYYNINENPSLAFKDFVKTIITEKWKKAKYNGSLTSSIVIERVEELHQD